MSKENNCTGFGNAAMHFILKDVKVDYFLQFLYFSLIQIYANCCIVVQSTREKFRQKNHWLINWYCYLYSRRYTDNKQIQRYFLEYDFSLNLFSGKKLKIMQKDVEDLNYWGLKITKFCYCTSKSFYSLIKCGFIVF